MRIIIVWITAISLIFFITLGWYTTLPVVVGVARAINSTISGNTNAENIATAVEYAAYIWGPLLCGCIILWAVISSQKRDVESEIYG